MQGSSDILPRLFPDGPDPLAAATLLPALAGDDPAAIARVNDALRRLSLLVAIAEIVTADLSLDRQLPQLIELIAAALEAERATLFLYDADSGELFSRVARGDDISEIRAAAGVGISGSVFGSGIAEIVADVYRDPRFNPEIDRRTGYRTRDILCVPLRNHLGRTIGVTEALNKRSGPFTELDIALLEAINMEHKQPCRAEETP